MPDEPINPDKNRVNYRLSDEQAAALDAVAAVINPQRPNRSAAARFIAGDALEVREVLAYPPNAFLTTLVHRWLVVLREERAHLMEKFDGEELAVLCGLLNGSLLDPWDTGSLYREARDGGLPRGLLTKLRGLSPGAELALVSAIERFWRLPKDSRPEPAQLLEYA